MRLAPPILLALSLSLAVAAGADPGTTGAFVVARSPSDVARLAPSSSRPVAAVAGGEAVPGDADAPRDAGRDAGDTARPRKRALLTLLLLAMSAPLGNTP